MSTPRTITNMNEMDLGSVATGATITAVDPVAGSITLGYGCRITVHPTAGDDGAWFDVAVTPGAGLDGGDRRVADVEWSMERGDGDSDVSYTYRLVDSTGAAIVVVEVWGDEADSDGLTGAEMVVSR